MMNDNRPSPEGTKGESSPSRLERRLKHWQPRPVELDAGEILRAAAAAERETNPMRRQSVERSEPARRRSPWIAIGVSWACGAVAGGLLTFLVMNRDASFPVASDEFSFHGESSVEPQELDSVEPLESLARHDNEASSVQVVPNDEGPFWSATELYVSEKLMEPNWMPLASLDAPPLRAGSHFRIAPSPVESSDQGSPERGSSAVPDWKWTDSILQESAPLPSPFLYRELLLQELLGTPSASL